MKFLRNEKNDKHTPSKHVAPQSQRLEPFVRQDNFFHLIPEESIAYTIFDPNAPREASLDRTIDNWHTIFQKRGPQAEHARMKLLNPDASREWRKFLKAIGYSERDRTERMRQKAAESIERLINAGVMEMLYHQMSNEERLKMIQILQEYDRDDRKPWRDWDSSDGITIYPSAKAWNQDHR